MFRNRGYWNDALYFYKKASDVLQDAFIEEKEETTNKKEKETKNKK